MQRLAARGESTIGRAHGACEIWVRRAAQREIKARGGGDAGTSLTTSNAEIALGLRTQFRNPHAAGPLADPGPFGFRRRSERGLLYFHRGLLARISHQLPTAAVDPGMSPALRSVGALGYLHIYTWREAPSTLPVSAASLRNLVRNAG